MSLLMSTEAGSRAELVETELRRLDRTLRALPEPPMRRERLLQRLESVSAEEAYTIMAAVLGRHEDPTPHLLHLREVLQDLLREGGVDRPFGYALCASVYAVAVQAGDEFVTRLLRSAEPAARLGPGASTLPATVSEIPLGVRRSLARGVDLGMLERLLLDADPVVIEHLLENPRITEEHAVRIAAHRPIAASTLDRLQRSRRFGMRSRVRTAIARNPYCPTPLAIQLLGTLPLTEVRSMADDGTLHEETRRHAQAELGRRHGRDEPA